MISAFASEADLYILDEPTAGLDPLMERLFQESILEVKRHGKTVLLSSHILSEVEKLCDRVAIIREGELIETGTLSQMRHLTRTKLTVETRMALTGLSALKGVHDAVQTTGGWVFQVDSEEMEKVISHISSFGVLKLESAPPTLEDLFIRHYKGNSEEQSSVNGGA